MMKNLFLFGAMLSLCAVVSAQTNSAVKPEPTIVFSQDFADGEELFQLNRPAEAIPYFERIIDDKTVHPAVFIYLGVAYYQVADYQKSLAVCVKGLARADTDHKVLAYNAGNSAYALGNYARADACYAIALKEDPDFSAAYLNRANAKLKQDHLEDARDNYRRFIALEPEDAQRPAIEQLLALLDEEITRRANEKPERITPEDMNIANLLMQIPDTEAELFADDMPLSPEEPTTDGASDEVHAELVNMADLAAPELPPEERTITPAGEVVPVDADLASLVAAEAAATPPETADVLEETVVREAGKDILDAEEAARKARDAARESVIEEEVELLALPEAEPRPREEPKPLEKIATDDIPAQQDEPALPSVDVKEADAK